MARKWVAVAFDYIDLNYFEWRKEKCGFIFDEVHFFWFVKISLFVNMSIFQEIRFSLSLLLKLL